MKKIQCQLRVWVSQPPASRPIEPPLTATNANTPIARACSGPAGNSVTMIARMTDEAKAPPRPCTKRPAISMPSLSESAAPAPRRG